MWLGSFAGWLPARSRCTRHPDFAGHDHFEVANIAVNADGLERSLPFARVRQEFEPVLIGQVVAYVSQKWSKRSQGRVTQKIGFAAGFNADMGQLQLSGIDLGVIGEVVSAGMIDRV